MTGSPGDVLHIEDWNRLLDGRVAVVTGGAGIARLFVKHSAFVELAEVDRERADRIQNHVLDVTVVVNRSRNL